MFKVGDKVICVRDNYLVFCITKGNTYVINSVGHAYSEGSVSVHDDKGKLRILKPSRFVKRYGHTPISVIRNSLKI